MTTTPEIKEEAALEPQTSVPEAAPEQYDRAEALKLFLEFDAATEAETSRPEPASIEESRDRLRALIEKLPQRAAIEDANAERWLERTMRMAHDRMEIEHGEGKATAANIHSHVFWHIRRASGIGGSEAGTVVKHFRGKRGTFGDANALVKEKLLIMSPQNSTEVMSRGIRAEPWIQKIHHEHEKMKTDEDALQKLRGFRWAKRPAGIGTPDDIVIPQSGYVTGQRELVDYKAPSADVMKDYDTKGVSFDYVCQLHHYEIIARAAGVKIDGRSIRALDPRGFRIASFPVELDSALARELSWNIDRLWHENIMMGVVPAAPKPDDLEILDEELVRIGVLAAGLKVLEDDIKTRKDDLLKRISAAAGEWHDIATGKLNLVVGSYSRDRVWDEETLRDLAISAGVDASVFEKADKKLDQDIAMKFLTDLHKALMNDEEVDALLADFRIEGVPMATKLDMGKLADELENQGVSTVTAARVKETLRLSQKKSGPEADRLSLLRGEVSDMAEAIETAFEDQVARIIKGEEQAEALELDDSDLGIEP